LIHEHLKVIFEQKRKEPNYNSFRYIWVLTEGYLVLLLKQQIALPPLSGDKNGGQ